MPPTTQSIFEKSKGEKGEKIKKWPLFVAPKNKAIFFAKKKRKIDQETLIILTGAKEGREERERERERERRRKKKKKRENKNQIKWAKKSPRRGSNPRPLD